ncbi:MAG: RraA family protein [Halobacteriales archaeon]
MPDPEDREALLDLYEGLRVADVVDGLDYNGFHDIGRMDEEIRPLYRDTEAFSHRIVGFAHTVRFHPTNERRDLPGPRDLESEAFAAFESDWYRRHFEAPTDIREGDVVVIEAHGLRVGNVGSMNALAWCNEGANGVVTNGGVRDTDELTKQGIPTYHKHVSKPIVPGRDQVDDEQVPVNVGACLVRPGDVVVADGDGVAVVPLEHARAVAEDARRIQREDQDARREAYEAAGLDPDVTLE